jgi:dTDP-4-dehydrorhamnose 3,5-epimerase
MITAIPTALPEVLLLEHRIFGDERGFFYESFNENAFAAATGVQAHFVQDNHSRSSCGVLRGLHYQIENAQGKLVRVAQGTVYDVAVDMRKSSATFGQWIGVILDDKKRQSLWVPPGFAHGFLVLSEYAEFLYKTTDFYNPSAERSLRWNDPHLAISWPLEYLQGKEPQLAAKDNAGSCWKEAEYYS